MKLKKWMEMLFCNENVNAILLFLLGMAIITVIARMADSFMVPQVVVGSPKEMSLQYPMEIEGQICAKGKQAMYCRENLRIAQVMVQKGDTVEKEDLLFTIDKENLQEQIRQTEQEIQKCSLQMEDLEQAYRKQAAQQSQDYSRAKEDYQDAQRSAESAVNAAYLEMERARQELAQHDSAKPNEMAETAPQTEEEPEQEGAEKASQKQEMSSKEEEEPEQEDTAKPNGMPETAPQKEEEPEQEDTAKPSENQETVLKRKGEPERENGVRLSNSEKRAKADKIASAIPEYEAETGHKEGGELEAANTESILTIWSQKREGLAQQFTEKQKLYEEAMDSKDASLKAAARQVEDCSKAVSKDNAQALLQMDQENLSHSLQKLKEIEQADGKIYADQDGKISECNLSTGAITSTEPVLVFEDLSQPLQFEGLIDKLSYSQVKEGIECSLKINGEPVLAEGLKISKVTEEGSEQGNYLVIAEISSDSVCQTGEATLSFTQESQRYQDCVPISSLYTGNAGNYIMGIKEDITILGIQTVAEMIPVTPIEENGEYVAVKEHLSAYDAIIVSASKSIKEGDRVRITEE